MKVLWRNDEPDGGSWGFGLDLGDDHWLGWLWGAEVNQNFDPANPEPDHRPVGAHVGHRKSNGDLCIGGIWFDIPEVAAKHNAHAVWQVNSWLPLDVSPSLLCSCGDHGFIREGKWVRA